VHWPVKSSLEGYSSLVGMYRISNCTGYRIPDFTGY
jgi:hypothetical protein